MVVDIAASPDFAQQRRVTHPITDIRYARPRVVVEDAIVPVAVSIGATGRIGPLEQRSFQRTVDGIIMRDARPIEFGSRPPVRRQATIGIAGT